MDLSCLTPQKLHQQIESLTVDLNEAQSRIADLIKAGPDADPEGPASHIRLDGLRFERNTLRSRLLDATAFLHALEESAQARCIVSYFGKHFPAEYQDLVVEGIAHDTCKAPYDDESSMLSQALEQCYRKIESSHKDQISMMTQIHENSLKLEGMGDWIERVNFALANSRSFFARKCHTLRKLRDQMASSLKDEEAIKLCNLVKARLGHGFIDHLKSMTLQDATMAA